MHMPHDNYFLCLLGILFGLWIAVWIAIACLDFRINREITMYTMNYLFTGPPYMYCAQLLSIAITCLGLPPVFTFGFDLGPPELWVDNLVLRDSKNGIYDQEVS
ncbi:uncharacterized protein LTR77_000122 [Saxophila tyrrhenica]|uniref:Uncharacterized protein n=1 Tax=Saxophila tyrrhenica TaxID=1690608 RepID=A0AAV9PLW1_9PEZI|nr:hypothetical protein LTR77_000122 [Saxophila tyrrhenica]